MRWRCKCYTNHHIYCLVLRTTENCTSRRPKRYFFLSFWTWTPVFRDRNSTERSFERVLWTVKTCSAMRHSPKCPFTDSSCQRWRESQLWNLLPNFKISACSRLLGRVQPALNCQPKTLMRWRYKCKTNHHIYCLVLRTTENCTSRWPKRNFSFAFDLKTDVETGTVRKDLLKECVMVKTYSTKRHSPKCLFYRFVLPWRPTLIGGGHEHIHPQRWSGSLLMAVRGGEKVSCGIFFPTSRFRLVHDYLVEFNQLATAQSRLDFQTVVGFAWFLLE